MPSELKNKHKVGLLINLAAKELELLSATERKSTAKTHVKAFQMSLRCRNHTRAFCHHSNMHKCISPAGGHESALPESMVNPVLINKKVKRSKSCRGDVPVRKVTLETINGSSSEDDLLWRIHLGAHRRGQAPGQGDSWDLSHSSSTPWSFDNQRLISKGNGTPQTKEPAGASELSELRQLGSSTVLNSLSKENGCNISSSCQKPPLKSATAALWAHQQISPTKCMPACNKLNFYPFPNRKGPRISEAARRLGLYVSQ